MVHGTRYPGTLESEYLVPVRSTRYLGTLVQTVARVRCSRPLCMEPTDLVRMVTKWPTHPGRI